MTRDELATLYQGYIACLNRQDWEHLGHFVHPDVTYNGTRVGLAGYRAMLERDFREIPDLVFRIHLLVADPPTVASRLNFKSRHGANFSGCRSMAAGSRLTRTCSTNASTADSPTCGR